MKAIVLQGVNTPFSLQDFDAPQLSPGEVLIRLHAAAFNHRDVFISKGQYAGLKFPIIPGSDGAGVVVEANGDLGQSWVGKEVIFNPGHHWGEDERAQSNSYTITGLPEHGTFAEFVKMPVGNLVHKPSHLSWEEAAALPLAALTAYRALFSRAQLSSGERVLITGIGGGVALMGLQMATAMDCKVWVTSGDEQKIARATELGAAGGVNYRDEHWPKQLKELAGAFDVILDGAGGKGFASLLDLAAPGARIAIYGGTTGKIPDLSPQKIFWKQLSILGSTMGSDTDFDQMVSFVELHKIVPVVDTVFPLVAADEAARRMDAGGQFGKIVLKIL
jgi:NADPH:quinone reductase-like Zn-dependent oxidoreductase